jgi:hypothetical protein
MKSFFSKYLRTTPWLLLVIVAMLIGSFLPIFPDGSGGHTTLAGFVLTWLGTIFKAISAAIVAVYFSRHVLKLDLSEISDPHARALAGLGQALVIAAFVLGVTRGL